MALHCDVIASPRLWRIYFSTVIECLRELMRQFRAVGLLTSHGNLEVWKEHYLPELGGHQVLHAPLGASIDDFLDEIERVIQEKLGSESVPFSIRQTMPIYLHLDGLLSLESPDGGKYKVPFDVVMMHRIRKKSHGDIYLRTFTHFGNDFMDFFTGSHSHVKENRRLLIEALHRFVSETAVVRRVIMGPDIDAYNDLTRAFFFFSRNEERLIEDLLETASTLRRSMKDGRQPPKPLTANDLEIIDDRTKPVNKTYLMRRIIKHPFYQLDVPSYYAEHDVIRQEGSILIYQKNFQPMTSVHALILKDISRALQKALKPREQFDKELIEGLNEIHEKKKKHRAAEEQDHQQEPSPSRQEEKKETSTVLKEKLPDFHGRKDRIIYWLEKSRE